jgi:hypothetical protein
LITKADVELNDPPNVPVTVGLGFGASAVADGVFGFGSEVLWFPSPSGSISTMVTGSLGSS